MNVSNPYYEEYPFFQNVPVKINAGITTCMALFGAYLNAFQAPDNLSKVFRILVFYHLFMLALTLIVVGWFSFPQVLLPYFAVHGVGLLTDWGFSQRSQCQFILCLWIGSSSTVGALFYYRLDVLLPPGHPLNKQTVRAIIYTITYPFITFFSIPIIFLATQQDLELVKREEFEYYRVISPDIFKIAIVMTKFGPSNPTGYIGVVFYPFVVFYHLSTIAYCTRKIYAIVRTSRLSDIKKKQHIEVLKGLLGLIVALGAALILNMLPVVYIMFTQSWRCDLYTTAFFIGTVAAPTGVASYIISYGPYRRFIVRKLVGEKKMTTNTTSQIIVIT